MSYLELVSSRSVSLLGCSPTPRCRKLNQEEKNCIFNEYELWRLSLGGRLIPHLLPSTMLPLSRSCKCFFVIPSDSKCHEVYHCILHFNLPVLVQPHICSSISLHHPVMCITPPLHHLLSNLLPWAT